MPEAETIPPKTVLFLDHTASMGGGEIALLNLVQHLDARRYRPLVVLCADGPLVGKLRDAGVEVDVIPLDRKVADTRKDSLGVTSLLRLAAVWTTLRYALHLSGYLQRRRVDLVHANSLKADLIGGLAARLARRPVIWHIRDRIDDDYLPKLVVRIFRLLCRIVPTSVIANSSATLNTLHLGHRALGEAIPSGINMGSRMHFVHDGTGHVLIPAAPVAGQANATPLIGLVGRISPWKGQHIFLQAARWVREQHPDVRFQIIGTALFAEQEYERSLRQLADELGLRGQVEFTGFREDVPELIVGLDILVHASTTGEPFGQVIIEGMAAGKPVVATNGGGVPEIVTDGVTGLLVPMGDAEAMATAICRLLEDPEWARRMGRYGRERVQDHFTIANTAARVQMLYDEILAVASGNVSTPLHPETQIAFGRAVEVGQAKNPSLHLWRPALTVTVSVAAALFLSLLLRAKLDDVAPLSLPFLAAVVVAAALYGTGAGLIATFLSVLALAYYLYPLLPDTSFAVEPVHRARLILFVAVAILFTHVLSRTQRANRQLRELHTAANQARQDAEFLAKATAMLATSPDLGTLLRNTAYLANSRLSDLCAVDLLLADGSLRRVVVAPRRASDFKTARRLAEVTPESRGDGVVARALRSGAPAVLRSAAHPHVVDGGMECSQRSVLRSLFLQSMIVLPLVTTQGPAGSLSLFLGSNPDALRPADQQLAMDLAWRVALALSRFTPGLADAPNVSSVS